MPLTRCKSLKPIYQDVSVFLGNCKGRHNLTINVDRVLQLRQGLGVFYSGMAVTQIQEVKIYITDLVFSVHSENIPMNPGAGYLVLNLRYRVVGLVLLLFQLVALISPLEMTLRVVG